MLLKWKNFIWPNDGYNKKESHSSFPGYIFLMEILQFFKIERQNIQFSLFVVIHFVIKNNDLHKLNTQICQESGYTI